MNPMLETYENRVKKSSSTVLLELPVPSKTLSWKDVVQKYTLPRNDIKNRIK